MNDIDQKQNEPRMLDLLRARTLIYRRVKTYQAVGLWISLGLPLIGLVVSAIYPVAKPFIALVALVFSHLEVLSFDPWVRSQLKTAAKLQEEFDCAVLRMDWNRFLAGSTVDPEQFSDLGLLNDKDEKRLLGWYPADEIRHLPIHLARLVCQRTNIWYDSTLRKRYRTWLLAGFLALALSVAAVSLWMDPTVTSFVLSTLAPITPVMIWTFRERNRHASTCELLDRLNEDIKKLLDSSHNATEQELGARSRELQDAIYNHRVASPLIFEWVYNRLRPGMEAKMHAGAAKLVKDFGTTSNSVDAAGERP